MVWVLPRIWNARELLMNPFGKFGVSVLIKRFFGSTCDPL